jgi:hypothetical protein
VTLDNEALERFAAPVACFDADTFTDEVAEAEADAIEFLIPVTVVEEAALIDAVPSLSSLTTSPDADVEAVWLIEPEPEAPLYPVSVTL